jgi:hypothetical protein
MTEQLLRLQNFILWYRALFAFFYYVRATSELTLKQEQVTSTAVSAAWSYRADWCVKYTAMQRITIVLIVDTINLPNAFNTVMDIDYRYLVTDQYFVLVVKIALGVIITFRAFVRQWITHDATDFGWVRNFLADLQRHIRVEQRAYSSSIFAVQKV